MIPNTMKLWHKLIQEQDVGLPLKAEQILACHSSLREESPLLQARDSSRSEE